MKKFNLSDWALDHASLVWYFMLVFALLGFFAYQNLGREEDPSFVIKTMTISAAWPGASVEETTRQVTERIERKLEELESLDFTRSITTPGQTLIFVNLKPTTRARDVAPTWVTVRNMISDIRGEFPSGVVGPAFNDRFGDEGGRGAAVLFDFRDVEIAFGIGLNCKLVFAEAGLFQEAIEGGRRRGGARAFELFRSCFGSSWQIVDQ